ncbi:MAG: ABC transporter ATP-binding protein [Chlorobi bacterium]|nr:MAG: ABC transporter, ATP-binding protein [Chlorobi bacterium OLB7]MBK8911896.1 ABC transporter ATP-binding protein [Chlorobiota bacterium]MBX7215463.1 ABC transporter ATP-binding protein [Candidatus Kapabacteria bacterium]
MPEPAISIHGLEKIYKGSGRKKQPIHALKPLHLEIPAGQIFGLLGPNGAGKTTLVKLLLGIVFPTSGKATIQGRAAGTATAKQIIGYLPENHRYPPYLTGLGVLHYFGQLSGLDTPTIEQRSRELLEIVQMGQWSATRIRQYSKGMMQRIGLAQAMLNNPDVIFLDEPTDGVDPVGRREIREIIAELKAQGKTVFLNSHLLSEVELICDRVAIMNKGELVRMGTVKELTAMQKLWRIEVDALQQEQLRTLLPRIPACTVTENAMLLTAETLTDLNHAIDAIRSAGILLSAVRPERQSLEDLFIDIITEGGVK